MANNYRQKFIKAYPGVRIPGYPGWWYICQSCGRWCARPGNSGYIFPDHLKMEVDHIVPFSRLGSDNLDNLQPLCKPCNRAKGNSMDAIDLYIAQCTAASKGKRLHLGKRRKPRSQY